MASFTVKLSHNIRSVDQDPMICILVAVRSVRSRTIATRDRGVYFISLRRRTLNFLCPLSNHPYAGRAPHLGNDRRDGAERSNDWS